MTKVMKTSLHKTPRKRTTHQIRELKESDAKGTSKAPVSLLKEFVNIPSRILQPDDLYKLLTKRIGKKYHDVLPLLTRLFFAIASPDAFDQLCEACTSVRQYSAPLGKAKDSLASVGSKIMALKEAERKAAEDKIRQAHQEFDAGAKELLRRVEAARQEDDAKFREEFESERERISPSYDEKLKTEIQRSQELTDQRMKNELTEQAIELKRKLICDVKGLVEEERDGRLSKLSDLSHNVDDLQQLTNNWNLLSSAIADIVTLSPPFAPGTKS
jgi:hypothetical protein